MKANSIATLLQLFHFFEKIDSLAGKSLDSGQKIDAQFKASLTSVITKTAECIYEFENENIVSWGQDTTELLDRVGSGTVSLEEIKSWIMTGKNLLGLLLGECIVKGAPIRSEEAETILHIFETNPLREEVKGKGFFALSELYQTFDPKKSFEYGQKAFQTYGKLGSILGGNYDYDESHLHDIIAERCPICGSEESDPFKTIKQFAVNDTPNTFSPYKLWMKCRQCGNLYAYNFPVSNMGEINGHYTRNSAKTHIAPRFLLSTYSDIFNKCRNFTLGNRYLEIGIGNGEMLASALEFGFDVDAIEICREDCETVSAVLNLDVKWCDFMNFESDKTYDVIIMGDVLEHVSDPAEAIKKAASLLHDDGVLWLSTPNFNSGFSRLVKDLDPMWNQRNHYTYFSYEGLVPILEKEGLEVRRYDISNRYNGSMELYITKKQDAVKKK